MWLWESTLFYCPIKTLFFLTHNGRSPCSLGASKVQPPFKNCSQISTLPEYAAQCKLVFSSCKQRYPKLNAEILTYHNSQLLIILLTNKCAEVFTHTDNFHIHCKTTHLHLLILVGTCSVFKLCYHILIQSNLYIKGSREPENVPVMRSCPVHSG